MDPKALATCSKALNKSAKRFEMAKSQNILLIQLPVQIFSLFAIWGVDSLGLDPLQAVVKQKKLRA